MMRGCRVFSKRRSREGVGGWWCVYLGIPNTCTAFAYGATGAGARIRVSGVRVGDR